MGSQGASGHPGRQGKAWTTDENEQFIAEVREGLTADVIAERHERTASAIRARAVVFTPRTDAVDRDHAFEWLAHRLTTDGDYDWRTALADRRRRGRPMESGTPASGQVPVQAVWNDPLAQGDSAASALPALRKELSQLVSALSRASGLAFGQVNQRLNIKLGITSRVGADAVLLQRAVDAASEWLSELEQPEERAVVQAPAAARNGARAPKGPAPTQEQQRAVDVFGSGEHLVLQAGAGTGKTTTLTMLARSVRRRGQYIAFNRPVAQDAATKFPDSVECRTAHSLAYRAVGRDFQGRLESPRQPGWVMGQALGIARNMLVRLGERKVTNKALSYVVFEAVRRFCYSADREIGRRHVPPLRGLEDARLHGTLVDMALPFAQKAWADLQNPERGVVRFTHDHYLKIWALQRPVIRTDYLLLDEAQDTNPVVEEVFNAQRSHAQLVMVGDSAQAIYGWRGARDVMTGFEGQQLSLSRSFRFGPRLALEANRWLTIVDAPIRLQGSEDLDTNLGPVKTPDAVLCRTNGGAIEVILKLLEENSRVAFVGGGGALLNLAKAAIDLKEGRRTSHPELILFTSWGELQEYATYDPSGADLLPLVDVIDDHGADVILDALSRLDDEHQADVAVSTAHKAKGREWPRVQIARDFEPSDDATHDEYGNPVPAEINLAEARLAYVAVTRARQRLDLGGLSWIEDHPKNPPQFRRHDHGRPHAEDFGGEAPSGPSGGSVSPWDALGPPPDEQRH